MKIISIIVPCYNEEESIQLYIDSMTIIENQINCQFEYIFIDDGSKDNTLTILKEQYKKNKKYNYITFSRNFGKEGALYAGLLHANGDYISIMDVDLQDPPELLIEMYQKITTTEKDIIIAKRTTRKGEKFLTSLFSRGFYFVMNKVTDVKIKQGTRDYRLMTRQVVNSILELNEYNRFSKGMFNWVGYDKDYIDYENVERQAGKGTWKFWGLWKYAINGIINFSDKPLSFISSSGITLCISAILYGSYTICKTLILGETVKGYPTLITSITFFSGIQLFSLGIIGKYISKIFYETKKRPVFIIKKDTFNKEEK